MYLVINEWVIAVKVSNFSGQYLRNHWTLDIGVLGYIGIVWPKEHSPEVWHISPGTLCMYVLLSLGYPVSLILNTEFIQGRKKFSKIISDELGESAINPTRPKFLLP